MWVEDANINLNVLFGVLETQALFNSQHSTLFYHLKTWWLPLILLEFLITTTAIMNVCTLFGLYFVHFIYCILNSTFLYFIKQIYLSYFYFISNLRFSICCTCLLYIFSCYVYCALKYQGIFFVCKNLHGNKLDHDSET